MHYCNDHCSKKGGQVFGDCLLVDSILIILTLIYRELGFFFVAFVYMHAAIY